MLHLFDLLEGRKPKCDSGTCNSGMKPVHKGKYHDIIKGKVVHDDDPNTPEGYKDNAIDKDGYFKDPFQRIMQIKIGGGLEGKPDGRKDAEKTALRVQAMLAAKKNKNNIKEYLDNL